MNPPDRMKRPSARPSARPSSPPPAPAPARDTASTSGSLPKKLVNAEPVAHAARDANVEPGARKPRPQGKKKAKSRASARRPSLAPSAVTSAAAASNVTSQKADEIGVKVGATPASEPTDVVHEAAMPPETLAIAKESAALAPANAPAVDEGAEESTLPHPAEVARAPEPKPPETAAGKSTSSSAAPQAPAASVAVNISANAPPVNGMAKQHVAAFTQPEGHAFTASAEAMPSAASPAPPTSTAASVSAAGPASHSHAEAEDDGDVFGDSGAVPMAAVPSYSFSEGSDETDPGAQPARGRDRLTKSSSGHRKRDEVAMVGSAQQLDTNDYYFRQYGAQAIRNLSAEVDDFGLDPHFEKRARPALEALVKRYFRVDVDGADNLPTSGRALIVANHAGALPWDGLVLRTALRVERPSLPPVRWLAEDTVFHYPFLGVTMNRLGAVRACQENAERLLAQDRLVAVFPEGAQGSSKLFRDRYRLQRFGRGGYVKLALKLGAPIIPTAIIGAEETNPLLARVSGLGRALGANFLPITPTFPWLGPLGLLPAPVKWRVVVGEPIDVSSYGEHAADDALVVHRLNEQIRSILQALVDQAKAARRSVLFG